MAVYVFRVMLYLDELADRVKYKQRPAKTHSDATHQNMFYKRVIIQPSIL